MSELIWQYSLVFVTAAIPLLEVMVVVPASVAAGLHPIPVGIVAFAGNATTLAAATLAADGLSRWVRGRRSSPVSAKRSAKQRARRERVRRIAGRWGLPGVALLAPVTVGTHVAAVSAVAIRLPRTAVLIWSLAGLAAWTTVFTALSAFGRSMF